MSMMHRNYQYGLASHVFPQSQKSIILSAGETVLTAQVSIKVYPDEVEIMAFQPPIVSPIVHSL